jgi:AcrR family transcriptional regulator
MADHNTTPGSKRVYHSPMRERQAEETRRRMLDAARALLRERGYAGTTVDAIAEAAGVSPKTVAAAFGSKRGILAEVLDPSGFSNPHQRVLTRLRAERDPARRVALAAHLTRRVFASAAAEFELLRGAGAVAPELAEVARQVEQRRWHRIEQLVDFLREHGALRADLAPAAATDEAWALASFDVYWLLVRQRGWRPKQYEAWLTQTLIGRLIGPSDP